MLAPVQPRLLIVEPCDILHLQFADCTETHWGAGAGLPALAVLWPIHCSAGACSDRAVSGRLSR